MLETLLLVTLSRAAPAPPLCRVIAAGLSNPLLSGLRTVSVKLRPDCPPGGHAWVRLTSESGATDPVYGWIELTADFPAKTFLGVLGNWFPAWEAASGMTYRVVER